MRVVFIPGGSLNEMGPFEPNAVIEVEESIGKQLIADGLATLRPSVSQMPITITLTAKENSNV